MVRFVFRFVGLLALTGALTWLVRWSLRPVYISSVGSIWENISQSGLGLQSAIDRLADVWHEVIQPYFLKQPVWLVLAIIGAILILIGRKKKPPIERAQN
jgi:hypothetical protein